MNCLMSHLLQKGETPVSPAPPADKKAKMEKVPDDSSLKAGHSSPSTVLSCKAVLAAQISSKIHRNVFDTGCVQHHFVMPSLCMDL